jgi:hypothetical protein
MLVDVAQILIAWMRLSFAIAALLNHCILARGNHGFGSFGCNLVIAMAIVVSSPGRNLFYRRLDALKHISEHFPFMAIVEGYHCCQNLSRRLIYPQM